MIIVRLLSPERSWLVGSHQSLLGYRSRHCHGINFAHEGIRRKLADIWAKPRFHRCLNYPLSTSFTRSLPADPLPPATPVPSSLPPAMHQPADGSATG